jgi:hypothetical protein
MDSMADPSGLEPGEAIIRLWRRACENDDLSEHRVSYCLLDSHSFGVSNINDISDSCNSGPP